MTNSNLLDAILAMDTYNRGYNYGIDLGNTPQQEANGIYTSETIGLNLGNVKILQTKGDLDAQSIGFYGIAYEYNGEVIVSYRGTDGSLWDDIKGFGVGAGYATSGNLGAPVDTLPERAEPNQGDMAFAFYRAVADQIAHGVATYPCN